MIRLRNIPETLFCKVRLVNDLYSIMILNRVKRHISGREPDVKVKSVLGGEELISRRDLLKNYRQLNGKKLKMILLKEEKVLWVKGNRSGLLYALKVPNNGVQCKGGVVPPGKWVICRADEEGHVDYSKDFFGKEANLTVSGQLNAEIMALAFRNVYTFGPTFRAENSYTGRHASEFWMIEPEIAFADLEDNMELAEDMVKYIINYVLEHCPEEMEFFNAFVDKGLLERLHNIVNSDFIRITYTKAVELLLESGQKFEYPVEWGIDLQTEHERYITEQIFKAPVFVTDYPKDIKAFYMRLNEDGKTVRAMDLLVPGVGEIIGGSQREEREDVLLERIEEFGLNKEDYWWYLELRKFGTATHSGFGLGFERMIMYLTGVSNIRDVIPFPRTPKNCEF